MNIKRCMYVVGMHYIANLNSFEPEVICGTHEEAKQWIEEEMEGYQYNGMGHYIVREIPYVS